MDARRTAIEDEGETLDVGQAAARLGVSPDAVRKRIRRGTIRGYKVDGGWRVVLPTVSPLSPDSDGGSSRTGPESGLDVARDAALAYFEREHERLVREHDRLLALTEQQAQTIAELVARLSSVRVENAPTSPSAPEPPTASRRRSWRPSWLWLWRWPQREPSR